MHRYHIAPLLFPYVWYYNLVLIEERNANVGQNDSRHAAQQPKDRRRVGKGSCSKSTTTVRGATSAHRPTRRHRLRAAVFQSLRARSRLVSPSAVRRGFIFSPL